MIDPEISNNETIEKIILIIKGVKKLYIRFIIVTLISFLSFITYILLDKYFNLTESYKNILLLANSTTGLWITVLCIFIIGIILFLFKLKQQLWYGIFETVFALISCGYITMRDINPKTEMIGIFVAITSSLYLTVRGLSNINDGLKKDYWLKQEFKDINNINSFSQKSIINLLKDKQILVNILTKVANLIIKYI